MDSTLLYVLGTIIAVGAGLAYSEWRIRRLMRNGPAKLMRAVKEQFFEEVDASTPDGKKMRLLRPNARLEAILEQAVPGILEWGMKHVKINPGALMKSAGLPSVNAEQLGEALMGGVAQKAMSGKKLKTEDLMQAALGYFMPRLQGVMAGFGVGTPTKPGEKPKPPEGNVQEEMHR